MFSIIIPAYNEEKGLEEVVKRTEKTTKNLKKEIIIVDDGSKDDTYKVARRLKKTGILVLRHKQNKGKTAALKTAYEKAKGDIFLNIDADCTYPPEVIPQLIQPIERREADVVLASRFLGETRGMRTLNYLGNRFFSLLVSLLTGEKITDASTGMRAFTRKVYESLTIEAKGLEWEVEMTTKALKSGFRVVEIPIVYSERVGASKLRPLRDGYGFFKAIIKARL